MNPTEIIDILDWHDIAPWRRPSVFLLLVPEVGIPVQSHDVSGKRALSLREDGTLMVGWNGQYRTDVRIVTDDDRERVRDHLA